MPEFSRDRSPENHQVNDKVDKAISGLIEGASVPNSVKILDSLLFNATQKRNELLAHLYEGPVSIEELASAVIHAFPRKDALSRALLFRLNLKLEHLVPDSIAYGQQVEHITNWACLEYEAGPLKFIQALREENPGNPLLKQVEGAFVDKKS